MNRTQGIYLGKRRTLRHYQPFPSTGAGSNSAGASTNDYVRRARQVADVNAPILLTGPTVAGRIAPYGRAKTAAR